MTSRTVLFKAFADVAIRASGLITFPIVARHVGADGYGAYTQVAAVTGLVVPLASLGLGSGMVRFFSVQPWSRELSHQILRVGARVAVVSLLFTLVSALAAPWLNSTLLGYPGGDTLFRWASLLVVTGALEFWLLDLLRARNWLVQFIWFQLLQTALVVAATAVLLTSGHGLVALVQATIAIKAGLVAAVVAGFVFRGRRSGHAMGVEPPPALATIMRFGFPLTIAGLGLWMVHLSDRLVVGGKLGAAALGRYGVVYSLATLLVVATAALYLPAYARLVRSAVMGDHEQVAAEIRLFHRYLALSTVPVALWLIVIIQPAILVLGGPEFHIPIAVVLLLVAALFLNQWNGLAHYVLTAYDRTALQQNVWIAAGVLNIVACLALVPLLKLNGAALATLLCFIGIEGVFFATANRYVDLGRNYRLATTARATIAAAAGAAAAKVVLVLAGGGGVTVVAATAAFFVTYAAAAVALGELRRAELDLLVRAFRPAGSTASGEAA